MSSRFRWRWLRLAGLVPALFLVLAAAPGRAADMPVDLELVLAADVSGSIDPEEARLQRDGYVKAIADPGVVAAIRSGMLGRIAVSYMEWAGEGWQRNIIGWRMIHDQAGAEGFAAELAKAPITVGPWTSISAAIDFARPMFTGNRFEGARRVIDISGDGPNNTGRLAPAARDDAVRRGFIINGLPIVNDRFNISRAPLPDLDLYYKNCVIGGPGAFMVVAKNFADFARAIRRKLILEIAATDKPPPRLLIRAAARVAPPCDIGERRFRAIQRDEW